MVRRFVYRSWLYLDMISAQTAGRYLAYFVVFLQSCLHMLLFIASRNFRLSLKVFTLSRRQSNRPREKLATWRNYFSDAEHRGEELDDVWCPS